MDACDTITVTFIPHLINVVVWLFRAEHERCSLSEFFPELVLSHLRVEKQMQIRIQKYHSLKIVHCFIALASMGAKKMFANDMITLCPSSKK